MQKVNQRWPNLSAEVKAKYEHEAERLKEAGFYNADSTYAEILEALEEATAKLDRVQGAIQCKPLTFSACAFSSRALQTWQFIYDHMQITKQALKDLTEKSLEAPEPPAKEEVEELVSMPVGLKEPKSGRPVFELPDGSVEYYK
eukprot:10755505-Lingulodinium_polyedra.AAC.1